MHLRIPVNKLSMRWKEIKQLKIQKQSEEDNVIKT